MLLNLKETSDRKIYISSDLHLGHQKNFVWEARKFTSVEAHDEGVIGRINDIVRPNDILILLGDFCLNTPLSKFNEYLSRILCGNIYMLFGNHPNPHYKEVYRPLVKQVLGDNYTDQSEVFPLRYRNVVYYGHYLEVSLNGQFAVLCHYAISSWNNMVSGAWMLHGHEHSTILNHSPSGRDGKILDVGMDGHNCTPWAYEELKQVMDQKSIISVGHH
jgi:calcineurin-like phosphoesterase family protein